ncbi:MAG: peptidoglycan editing factor PgeF [Coxiellaceae bacterium]|nr:peptidoglycan editing factor PgeF [Coxiellaceae bacterium]
MPATDIITADWSAPKNIHAFTTTIAQGNMADHVPAATVDVEINRQNMITANHVPTPVTWLQQTHSDIAIQLPCDQQQPTGDASYTENRNVTCAVMTADCLPLLICQQDGREVAAIHAGWRGLMTGIIDSTIKAMSSSPAELMVWLGPAIGADALELNADIRNEFLAVDTRYNEAFNQNEAGAWFADIYLMARLCLGKYGVTQITGGDYCTYHDPDKFYSYRRQGDNSGRMASLIWIDSNR